MYLSHVDHAELYIICMKKGDAALGADMARRQTLLGEAFAQHLLGGLVHHAAPVRYTASKADLLGTSGDFSLRFRME